MKIASHDSMTYLPVKKWYMYPFKFMARCQSKTLQEQYEKYDVRMFDIRVSFDKHFNPEIRHGLVVYKGDVYDYLKYLNSKKDTEVRLILEEYKEDKNNLQELLFKAFCNYVVKRFSDIKFFGGYRKRDWKQIHKFKHNPQFIDKYSSNNDNGSTGIILDDWWPWLYARFMNKKNLKKYKDSECLMIDFVQIR